MSSSDNWRPIANAPLNTSVWLQCRDNFGLFELRFSAKRTENGWINAQIGRPLEVQPEMWRSINGRVPQRHKQSFYPKPARMARG
jgi:hypothetical protein